MGHINSLGKHGPTTLACLLLLILPFAVLVGRIISARSAAVTEVPATGSLSNNISLQAAVVRDDGLAPSEPQSRLALAGRSIEVDFADECDWLREVTEFRVGGQPMSAHSVTSRDGGIRGCISYITFEGPQGEESQVLELWFPGDSTPLGGASIEWPSELIGTVLFTWSDLMPAAAGRLTGVREARDSRLRVAIGGHGGRSDRGSDAALDLSDARIISGRGDNFAIFQSSASAPDGGELSIWAAMDEFCVSEVMEVKCGRTDLELEVTRGLLDLRVEVDSTVDYGDLAVSVHSNGWPRDFICPIAMLPPTSSSSNVRRVTIPCSDGVKVALVSVEESSGDAMLVAIGTPYESWAVTVFPGTRVELPVEGAMVIHSSRQVVLLAFGASAPCGVVARWHTLRGIVDVLQERPSAARSNPTLLPGVVEGMARRGYELLNRSLSRGYPAEETRAGVPRLAIGIPSGAELLEVSAPGFATQSFPPIGGELVLDWVKTEPAVLRLRSAAATARDDLVYAVCLMSATERIGLLIVSDEEFFLPVVERGDEYVVSVSSIELQVEGAVTRCRVNLISEWDWADGPGMPRESIDGSRSRVLVPGLVYELLVP